MSRADLTRWNRAGLRRFAAVDGNAALFLELLRTELRRRFGERWHGLPPDPDPRRDDEEEDVELGDQRENQRLVQQFQDVPGAAHEIGWELTRALSRSCHVLAEHMNAHANEAFLRTATQWESVRRIVELIDYHPASATSALTELVILATPGKSGTLPRGFQVKYTRVDGGPQIIFETLEDLEVHAELNELRPKGWDASEASSAPEGAPPGASPGTPSSPFDLEPVSVLAGADAVRSAALRSAGAPRLRDLIDLDPKKPGIGVPQTWLRELKIKAATVLGFALEPGWEVLHDLALPEIAAREVDELTELTGKDEDAVRSLQRRIELLGVCLDHPAYSRTRLGEFAQPALEPSGVETTWITPKKPKVQAGQVAMVWNSADERGEAVRIASINPQTQRLELTPSPLEYGWWRWPRSVARLRVVPRFKRKAWLNGTNVVRTREPHGLTKGAFVAWRSKEDLQFAEVTEADEWNLRLRTASRMPTVRTELFEARALAGPKVAPDLEFGLVGAPMPGGAFIERTIALPDATPAGAGVFRPPDDISPPSPPPGMPSGALSFGSFLFPSPFLPMDLVKAAVELLLSMGVMVIPSTGEVVFKFLPDVDLAVVELLKKIPEPLWIATGLTEAQKKQKLKELLEPKPGATESVLFKEFVPLLEQAIKAHGPLLAISKDAKPKAIVASSNPRYVFEGSAHKLEVGEWVVAELANGLRALSISEITSLGGGEEPERFSLSFAGFRGSVGELLAIHADFRGDLEPSDSKLNQDPIDPERIELSPVPASLKRGRKLLLTAKDKPPAQGRVTDVDAGGIRIEPPQPGFTKGELVIRGNVVAAGHGASKPVKQLSSGAATIQKSLLLEVAGVATVPDPTFPSGSKADLEVWVGNLRFRQVPRLDRSGPSDADYAVRATEEGFVRLVFGDGVHGRRLPSGSNNVRVRFRVGAGRGGNVRAGSLTKAAQPHWLVKTIEHPKDAVGGEELESVANMRERAPGTLLALERSVSIADFENLAASRTDVWQARAFYHPGAFGRLDLVRVVVVPAGGGDLEGPLRSELEQFLSEHAVPTTAVRVDGFSRKRVRLDVTIRVDLARFDATDVGERVRSTLRTRLDIERRAIAEPLYLAEVYDLVEGSEGVADSHCVFRGTDALRIVADAEDQVVYLDLAADPDDLLLVIRGYEP